MLELRGRDVSKTEISPGWPEPAVIAERLTVFMTDYMCNMGLHTLVLHSGPLPPTLQAEIDTFGQYVDSVYALKSPAQSYINHKFWIHHYPQFHRYRAKLRTKQQLIDQPNALEMLPNGWMVSIRLDGDPVPAYHVLTDIERKFNRVFGLLPRPTINHPLWAEFGDLMKIVQKHMPGTARRILVADKGTGILPRIEIMPGDVIIARRHQFHPVHFDMCEPNATMPLLPLPSSAPEGFDFCLCELNYPQLLAFRKMYHNLRPAMRPGGRIVGYHLCLHNDRANFRDRPIPRRHMESLIRNFPRGDDVVRFYFTGYPRFAPRIALRLFLYGLSFMPPTLVYGDLRIALAMTIGIPFACVRSGCAWLRRMFFSPDHIPAFCTAVTIEIEVSGAKDGSGDMEPASATGSGEPAPPHDGKV